MCSYVTLVFLESLLGLRGGEIIVAVDGYRVETEQQLWAARTLAPGSWFTRDEYRGTRAGSVGD